MSSLESTSLSSVEDSAQLLNGLIDASTGDQVVTSTSFKGFGHLRLLMSKYKPSYGPLPLCWSLDFKEPTTLKFPALLDVKSLDTKITPYFNNPANTMINKAQFRKTKAMIAVNPLPNDPAKFPREAIKCSRETVRALEDLAKAAEVKQNEFLDIDEKNVTRWIDTDDHGNITIKLQTEALFVEDGKKSMFGDEPGDTVDTLPDPFYRYALFFNAKPGMEDYRVVEPEIRDLDGSIIPPGQYHAKLSNKHGTPICVVAIPVVWDMQRTKNKQKMPSGKRVFQLLIQSIQLLPAPKEEEAKPPATISSSESCKRKWYEGFSETQTCSASNRRRI